MDSSKNNSFVINYCQYHETIDLYKIPYNFINEFIYYSQNILLDSFNEFYIFDIIDQFYGKIKLLDLNKKYKEILNEYYDKKNKNKSKKEQKNKILTKEEEEKKKFEEELKQINTNNKKKAYEEFQNIYLFSFDKFSEYYQKNLRAIINREQEDDKEHFSKVKSINREYKIYKRNNYFLSQKILNTYITFINNNSNELLKAFKLIKCENKNLKEDKSNQEKHSSNNININSSIININSEEDSKKNNSLKESEVNKAEEIDILNLCQIKSNMDIALKEKLFGIYNNLEIPNVIEENFIFQRYFSCYTLIKYSLLNIIAITREIKSEMIDNQNVIKIISYFCELTKLKSKKYINIYLKIFKDIYQKNGDKENFKIKECLNLISFYFEKNNLFLSEENKNFLNNVKSQVSSTKISSNSFENVKNKGKFFEISDGFLSQNKKHKFVDAIKTIETIYLGKYGEKIDEETKQPIKLFDFDYTELNNLYKKHIDNNIKKFYPKTPILLYDSTNKKLKKYLTTFSYDNNLYKDLLYDIISLLFYFKIPNIENKWIFIKKNKPNKNKNDKEKKSKIDKKGTKDEEKCAFKSSIITINDEESSINDVTLSSNKMEISQINININDKSNNKESLKIVNYEKDKDLNEILKMIISILYDLFNNIVKKYKSQHN